MKPRNNKATQFLALQEVTNIRLRTLVKCLFGADIIYLRLVHTSDGIGSGVGIGSARSVAIQCKSKIGIGS